MSQINSTSQRFGNIIFKNTAFVTGGNLLLKAISFLFSIFVIRRLGDSRFGQYTTVLAFVGLFQIFAEMGITQYVMREISRDRSNKNKYFWNLVVLRVLLALINILLIPFFASIYGYNPELILGVFLYTLTFLFAAFEASFQATLTAHEQMHYISAINVSGQVAFIFLGSIFLFSGLGFIWLVVARLLASIPRLGLGWWAVQRHKLFPDKVQINARKWPKLLLAGLPFGVIALTLTIATSIDTVMLSKSQPSNVVGWYNVAYGLIISITILPNGFKDAIVPTLTRAHVSKPGVVSSWYHHTTKLFIAIGVPLAVGGMILSEQLVLFLYSEEFLPAAAVLRILVWDLPFVIYAGFCGRITTIISEEKASARIYTVNAIANILLNLIFIPLFSMIGAAVVSVITDIISAIQFNLLVTHKLAPQDMRPHLLKIGIASIVMGLGVWATPSFHLFVRVGIGVFIYCAMILILRLPDETEKEWTRGGIQKLSRLLQVNKNRD